ncbi:hypothetical protein DDZ13_07755 [Coraliomargarita sinensis]|uniref:Ice-binding protein C-terminal domain-containing protein n=1 Tax=Coraliomargarita sinensis TaxID=2174842 RepID=A0A317ZJL0_9BACT|nr:PEP-CTERM sorting domain-containing protein [Coraliomargarita sinensis]PXA04417.1 hypothetical protein DDZ13_07755 [Coraliomargarita sinensis]
MSEAELFGPPGGANTSWNQYADEDTSGTVVDSTGASTTVQVLTDFSEGRGGSSSDLGVFRGSLTDFGRGETRNVDISGLAADGLYDIWIMAYRDNGTARERLGGYWTANNTTASATTQLLSSYNTRNGTTFEEGVNYIVFEDVVADGAGTISFTGVGGKSTDPDFNDDVRLGLSALQIQAVPEASTFALIGLAGLALIRRRR